MNMIINISKNRLKDKSTIVENMDYANTSGELHMTIEENELQDDAAILRNKQLYQEEIDKQKIYDEINQKIGEFSDWSDEYKKLQELKHELSRKESKMPQIVKKFGYDVTQGCLANLFSTIVIEIIKKYL